MTSQRGLSGDTSTSQTWYGKKERKKSQNEGFSSKSAPYSSNIKHTTNNGSLESVVMADTGNVRGNSR